MKIERLAALSVLLLAAATVAAPTYSVELRQTGPNKILVIKLVREITALGLKDAKDLVEAAPRVVKAGLDQPTAEAFVAKFREAGATAVILGADGSRLAVSPAPAPAPRTGAGLWSVTLLACGPKKIEVIKLVREATGLGLKESKDLVERTPSLVKAGLPAADAEALVNRLQFAGGTAKVVSDAP